MATASALSPVFLPRMISTSIMRSTGEKKWMPMKFFGRAEFFASAVIGMVEVLEANTADGFQHGFRLLGRHLLDLRILEHRLDDEVAAGEVGVVGGRRDQRQQLFLVLRLGAALLHRIGDQACRNAPCPSRRTAMSRSSSTTGMPALAVHIGDAGAHEAGAEHADLLELRLRHARPAGARPCSVPAARRTASGSSPPLPSSA